MRAIRNATNHELEWISPQLLSDEYELRIRDGELLAKLVMHGSNSADAVCVEGSFRFQRKGLFKTQTVVYAGVQAMRARQWRPWLPPATTAHSRLAMIASAAISGGRRALVARLSG